MAVKISGVANAPCNLELRDVGLLHYSLPMQSNGLTFLQVGEIDEAVACFSR